MHMNLREVVRTVAFYTAVLVIGLGFGACSYQACVLYSSHPDLSPEMLGT